jgi:hypothetical protein
MWLHQAVTPEAHTAIQTLLSTIPHFHMAIGWALGPDIAEYTIRAHHHLAALLRTCQYFSSLRVQP